MDLTEEQKRDVWGKLVDKIINALEQGILADADYSNVASYILENSEKVKTQEDMAQFLRDLSTKWPLFTDVLVGESEKGQKSQDQQVAENASNLAKSGNIDEALDILKSAKEEISTIKT